MFSAIIAIIVAVLYFVIAIFRRVFDPNYRPSAAEFWKKFAALLALPLLGTAIETAISSAPDWVLLTAAQ